MSYYTQINNVKYDKKLIDMAEKYKSEDNSLTWKNMISMLNSCRDAGKFTKIELSTVNYIYDNYTFDSDTKQHLNLILFLCNSLQSKQD
tara:strand:+ start:5799 stop:6065 length:267 start_codon:yes stop_codon:yes gene_type:complete